MQQRRWLGRHGSTSIDRIGCWLTAVRLEAHSWLIALILDDVDVDAEKAISMGWAPVPDNFKVGVSVGLLKIETEPPEPSQEAYSTTKDLFDHY